MFMYEHINGWVVIGLCLFVIVICVIIITENLPDYTSIGNDEEGGNFTVTIFNTTDDDYYITGDNVVIVIPPRGEIKTVLGIGSVFIAENIRTFRRKMNIPVTKLFLFDDGIFDDTDVNWTQLINTTKDPVTYVTIGEKVDLPPNQETYRYTHINQRWEIFRGVNKVDEITLTILTEKLVWKYSSDDEKHIKV